MPDCRHKFLHPDRAGIRLYSLHTAEFEIDPHNLGQFQARFLDEICIVEDLPWLTFGKDRPVFYKTDPVGDPGGKVKVMGGDNNADPVILFYIADQLLANPGVDRVFNRLREMSGQKVIPQQGAVRELIKILRQGKKIALLLDQNTKPAEGGIFVDFFGLPVPVSSAGAALAERTDAEIVMGFCLPQPDGSYRGHLRALLSPTPLPGEDKKQALTRLTQEITRQIEAEIRSNPGNWLWMYKRWKHVPPARSRQEYPFYAKNLPVNPAA